MTTGVQESTCSTIFAWVSVCAQIIPVKLSSLTVSASKLLWTGADVVVVCVETLCSILAWTGYTGVHIILTVPSLIHVEIKCQCLSVVTNTTQHKVVAERLSARQLIVTVLPAISARLYICLYIII